MASVKPLGRRSYGSIPHLPGSRLGPGDHHCHEGQARIACERPRDRHDEIIVQEKLDGSNVGVARIDGRIGAIGRAGYLARSSRHEQHRRFADWVEENAARFAFALEDGERLCGEWLLQAHGTIYELPHEPFVGFDIMVEDKRLPFDEVQDRLARADFVAPRVIHRGGPMSIAGALWALEPSGHGAIDPVEGAIWRVERKGEPDFICKYVRHDKADGKYLPDVSGGGIVWNQILQVAGGE